MYRLKIILFLPSIFLMIDTSLLCENHSVASSSDNKMHLSKSKNYKMMEKLEVGKEVEAGTFFGEGRWNLPFLSTQNN